MKLKNEHLIEVKPQAGTYVSLIDKKIIDEAIFMRKLLEKGVLREACNEFSEEMFMELEKNLFAQKLVLNMLSTGAMIKLGKVYGNLMVDVRATNEKLVERAKKIVCEATGVEREKAENILKETDFDVKLSIFMILSELNKDEAKKILDANKGYIAEALKSIE